MSSPPGNSKTAIVLHLSFSASPPLLEALGYVVRQQMPENRKNVHVFLTPKGKALKKKLVPLAEEVNRVSVMGLSVEDITTTRSDDTVR